MWQHLWRHLDRNGNVKQASFRPLVGWRLLRTYYGGGLQFQLNPDRVDVDVFEEFDSIQHWWRNEALGVMSAAGGFVRHQTFIYREREITTDANGVTSWTGFAYSPWTLLNQRRILFDDKTAGSTLFEGVEALDIAAALLSQNLSDTLGRWRSGVLGAYAISAPANSTDSPPTNLQTRAEPLGDAVVRLLDGLAAYVRLEQTTDTAWTVAYRAPYFGNDRSAEVIFSLKRNNMRLPRLRSRNLGRPTVAVGVGAADGNKRVRSDVRTGPSFAAWRDTEGAVDLRDVELKAQLNGEVDRALEAMRPGEEFLFDVIQTADTFYSGGFPVPGRNFYDLGDVVQADYFGLRLREVLSVEVRGSDVTDIVVETGEVVS